MRLAPAWSKGQLRELLNKAQGASDSDGEEVELREYLRLSYDAKKRRLPQSIGVFILLAEQMGIAKNGRFELPLYLAAHGWIDCDFQP
jgi:hypothetical protein